MTLRILAHAILRWVLILLSIVVIWTGLSHGCARSVPPPRFQQDGSRVEDSSAINFAFVGASVRSDLRTVYAIDRHRVRVAGTNGAFLWSDDAGRTWQQSVVLTESGTPRTFVNTVQQIQFTDSLTGWAAGSEAFLHTWDGGRKWQKRPTTGTELYRSIGFSSPDRGLLVGDGIRMRFYAGSLAEDGTAPVLTDARVAFVGLFGVLAGEGPRIYWTADGGSGPWHGVVTDPGLRGARVRDVAVTPRGQACVLLGMARQAALVCTQSRGSGWEVSPVDSTARAIAFGGDSTIWLGTSTGLKAGGPARGWSTITVGHGINDITFTDGGAGYAVGDRGAILSTTDEGRSWSLVSRDVQFRDVAQVSGDTLVVVGTEGILHSTDGGSIWAPAHGGSFFSVAFPTPEIGWAAGAAGVVRSEDGGARWTPAREPHGVTRLEFFDSVRGVAYTPQDTSLWLTEDAGTYWEAVADVPWRETDTLVHVRGSTRAAWALTRKALWRLDLHDRAWVSVTLPVVAPSARMNPKDSLPPGRALAVRGDTVWVAADDGIHRRVDGRGRWESFPSGGTEPSDLQFLPGRPGWVVGSNGWVAFSSTRGESWAPLDLEKPANLHAVTVLSDGRVVVAGEGGTLLSRTLNGDTAWTPMAVPRVGTFPPTLFFVAFGLILIAGIARLVYRADQYVEDIDDIQVVERPLRPDDRDFFATTARAKALARFIAHDKTEAPLSVAVTGEWGRGKSSTLKMTHNDLKRRGFQPVWFNASPHLKEDQLLASLLETIRSKGVPRWSNPLRALMFRVRLLHQRMRHHAPALALLCAVVIGYVGYVLWSPQRREAVAAGLADFATLLFRVASPEGPGKDFPARLLEALLLPAPGRASPVAPLLVLGLVLYAVKRGAGTVGLEVARSLSWISRPARLDDTRALAGDRLRFARAFEDVTAALGSRKMVIFIDDVDRARPEQVMELLGAVGFLTHSGNCVLVFGMDPNKVREHVRHFFQGLGPDTASGAGAAPDAEERKAREARKAAEEYLEKLIQLEIPVPPAETAQLQALIAPGLPEIERTWPVRKRQLTAVFRHFVLPGTLPLLAAVLTVAMLFLFLAKPRGRPPLAQTPPVATETVGAAAGPRSAPDVPVDTGVVVARTDPANPAIMPEVFVRPGSRAPAPLWVLALLTALAVGGVALWRLPANTEMRTKEFQEALAAWAPYLAHHATTIRRSKAFLHRLRYVTMLVKPEPESFWRSLFRREAWRRLLGGPPSASPADENLIALSAIAAYEVEHLTVDGLQLLKARLKVQGLTNAGIEKALAPTAGDAVLDLHRRCPDIARVMATAPQGEGEGRG